MSLRLALYLLGPPKLEIGGSSVIVDRRKSLALLAYLAVQREPHTRDYISALLWPEYDQAKAFTNLRHVLWETQQAIGEGWIVADHETIGLNGDADIWLDISHFDSLLAQSRSQTDISLRASLLADSVKLYRNHFLTGFSLKDALPFNEWAFAKSEELRHQLASALTTLSNDLCSLGKVETAIPHAQRLITLDPLNEASHRLLMQVYLAAGQHNAALKQYQTCEKLLRKELNVDPQPETRALYKQIRKGEITNVQVVKPKEISSPQHNLPFQVSKFIGREKELGEINNLMKDHRLVTLIGTGGIGKTRLSLKIGEQLVNQYADGVWLVELAPLADPALVPQTVAKLFNIIEKSEESITEKLIQILHPKTTLLILDNCEHLIEACAQLADALLKNCPNLNILATSRENLGITGEARYHVPPLTLPDLQQLLVQLLGYESVQLFEERARLVQENFSLTTINASSIAHICHRLDGIPLAIELAAARVSLLSPEQIAVRLDESFNLLTGGSRTTMPRHQTLRASIDWSWTLLSKSEQTLLGRLSIFAGGWTLDAAEAVCTGNGITPEQVLDLLTQLVAKSLVVINQNAESKKRYRLLEMVRQYAYEKLLEAGEEEQIRSQHLQYFLVFSEQVEYEVVRFQQMEWFARTVDERNNVRSALEYASETNVEAGLFISSRLLKFWDYYDNNEGARWLAEFIQKPEAKDYPLAKAKALQAQGWFMAMANQFGAARSVTEECLELCRAYGDKHVEVDALYLLGFVSEGDKKTAYLHQALKLARSLGDIAREVSVLNFLGWDHSDLQRALAYWEESIPLFRQLGNRRSLANCLSRLGYYLVLDGKIDSAQKYLAESRELFQQLNIHNDNDNLNSAYRQIAEMNGDFKQARVYIEEDIQGSKELGRQISYLWANFNLGVLEMREGNINEARQLLTETARAFQQDGYTIGVVLTLQYMGSLYLVIGKPEYAARLIGWANTTRAAIKNTRPSLEQAEVDRDIAACVARMGRGAFEEAYNRGCEMTLDEAVEYALNGGVG